MSAAHNPTVRRAQYEARNVAGGFADFSLGRVVCESYTAPFAHDQRGAPAPTWIPAVPANVPPAGSWARGQLAGGILSGHEPLWPAGAQPLTPIMEVKFTNLQHGYRVGPCNPDNALINRDLHPNAEGVSYQILQGSGTGPIGGDILCAKVHIIALEGAADANAHVARYSWLNRGQWDAAHDYTMTINFVGGAEPGAPIGEPKSLCAVYLVSSNDSVVISLAR